MPGNKQRKSQHAVGRPIIGVLFDRQAQHIDRRIAIPGRHVPVACRGPRHQTPSVEVAGLVFGQSHTLGCHELGLDRRRDALRNLVLKRKDVIDFAVVAIGPYVFSRGRVDQLGGYANLISGRANAPFQNVADAELTGHVSYVDRSAFVGEG